MNKLKKLWLYLFPPNDWKLISIKQDKCLVDHSTDGVYEYTDTKTRNYYIYFSRYRNLYKLETEGFRSNESSMYEYMLNTVINLNNELNE